MLDLNVVKLRGTICGEPKCVMTQNNSTMARFSVGVHRGEPSKAMDYLSVIAWGGVADLIKENYHDGSGIALVGSIQNNRYTSQDGQPKRSIRIVAEKIVNFDDDLMNDEPEIGETV